MIQDNFTWIPPMCQVSDTLVIIDTQQYPLYTPLKRVGNFYIPDQVNQSLKKRLSGSTNPNVAKVEYAVDPRRQGWASTETCRRAHVESLSRSQAVVAYREPLTIRLRTASAGQAPEMRYPRLVRLWRGFPGG